MKTPAHVSSAAEACGSGRTEVHASADETSSSGFLVMAVHTATGFYPRFYTAGWDSLVRSGIDRYVQCTKAQHQGTKRDRT